MRGLDFTAIDFRTANAKRGSVCAVGLAKVKDGVIVDTDAWVIRPPRPVNDFSPANVAAHGIRPVDVRGAPTWASSLERILVLAGTDAFVAHDAVFDRSVLLNACREADLAVPETTFHCSLDLARCQLDPDAEDLADIAHGLGLGEMLSEDVGGDAEMCASVVVTIARKQALGSLELLWPSVPSRAGEAPGPLLADAEDPSATAEPDSTPLRPRGQGAGTRATRTLLPNLRGWIGRRSRT